MLCFDSGCNIPLKKETFSAFLRIPKGWELNLFLSKNEKPGLPSKYSNVAAAESGLSSYAGAPSRHRFDVVKMADVYPVLNNC